MLQNLEETWAELKGFKIVSWLFKHTRILQQTGVLHCKPEITVITYPKKR